MLPLKEKDRPLAHKLLAAGCCARCVLRFCCVGTPYILYYIIKTESNTYSDPMVMLDAAFFTRFSW
uniref:Uncharacterized protein n=1 Tax=Denticeps clupeoides TaxID=299321 RepID=A0AAY4AF13_9TELE